MKLVKPWRDLCSNSNSSKHIGTEKSSLNSFTEQRRIISYVLVNQPSKGPSSGHMIQLSKGEQVHLLTLEDGNQPDQLSADPSLALVNDNDETGKQEQLSPEMEDLSSGNGSGKNELSFDPGPMDFSYDSIPQPGEDVSKSPGPVLDSKEPSRPLSVLEASQEHPSSEIINRDQDFELEQPPMPVSLENLCLVIGERESQDFLAMHSDDLESGEEIPSSSTGKPQDPAGYDQKQQPQRAASQELRLRDSQGDSQIQQVLDKATVQCQSGTSQGNIPSNQCWTLNNMPQPISMSGNLPQASSSPVSYSQPSTAQHSVNDSQQIGLNPRHEALNQKSQHISLSENHAQMSSSHASFSQPSTPQHSGQSSQQIEPLHHQEALNQTSQHHYQQQHLLHGQYQQHQLQMQQPYTSIQEQQMHPHPSQRLYQQQQLIQQSQQQTPLLQQQQYFQQIQSSQYQQQQYLLHQLQYLPQAHQLWQQQFQQQSQQMQPQEGQQTQQHYLQTQEQLEQYRQSQELAYQMQQHGYQLLLHQYQVHQQGYQSMQQQQQWQQQGHLQLQQYSHLQQQQYHHLEQQTDEDYNQTHQGQQVVEPHSSGTPAPESESPETARQPHSAEKS